MNDTEHIRKYFFAGLFICALVIVVLMLWPFAKVLIASIALAALFSPVFKWIHKKVTRHAWLASLLTIVSFVIILCIPLFLIGSIVVKQSQYLYSWVVEQGGLNMLLDMATDKAGQYFPTSGFNARQSAQDAVGSLSSNIGSMFSATLASIFAFFLTLLSMFYFLKDGARWKVTLMRLSPLSDKSDQKIISKLQVAVNGIVKGYLLIALIQGVLMGVGLAIFGVPNAALWGVLSAIASLVPTIGTALIAIPSIIFLFATGQDGAAIGFTVWSAVIVGTVDNLLNPIIVGKTIDIHPLLILLTVLGGIALMGPIGILIGPLVISFMYALISVYKSEVA